MGQSLREVAEQLRKTNKKVQLIYAFNGTGKTRLSREFKELVDPRSDDNDDEPPKVLYYNAFTEDLFYWDNDLINNEVRKLKIHPNAYTKTALEDLGLDRSIISVFQRYTNDKLTPVFNHESDIDEDGNQVGFPFSDVTFSLERGDDEPVRNLKISKGEESIFIWSIFYVLLDQIVSTLNVAEVDDRETDQFNELEYIFIDDPVSSLDENHLIELAVNVANLIKRSQSGLKFIITTHNPLFYNVLFNELSLANKNRNEGCYLLERLDDGTLELNFKRGDSNKSFSYHLHLKGIIEKAIADDQIEKYHFTLLRNLYEKTANFLNYPKWSELLPDDRENYYNRIIQFSSHNTLSDQAVPEPKPEEKAVVKFLLNHLHQNYAYWPREIQDG